MWSFIPCVYLQIGGILEQHCQRGPGIPQGLDNPKKQAMAGPQLCCWATVFTATSSLRKWGEGQVTLGPVKAGCQVGRTNPWWTGGWSWGEIMLRRGQYRRRGARWSYRRSEWWNYSVHPRLGWALILATAQTAYWPSDASLHVHLSGQALRFDWIQQTFTKCLPCSWCCARHRCSEVKGGPARQELKPWLPCLTV